MWNTTSLKKDQALPFVTTWMDLQSIVLSDTSQMEKGKDCTPSYICEIYDRKQQGNQQNKLTDKENSILVTQGEEGGGKMKRVKQVKHKATEEHSTLGGKHNPTYR